MRASSSALLLVSQVLLLLTACGSPDASVPTSDTQVGSISRGDRRVSGDFSNYGIFYSFTLDAQHLSAIYPTGPVWIGSNGGLYGTTSTASGNCYCFGAVYKLKSGTLSTIYRFGGGNNGADPRTGVVGDGTGALYGVTHAGGNNCYSYATNGCGIVFKLTPAGNSYTETILHRFKIKNSDGFIPEGLMVGNDGNLYGTTNLGGSGPCNSGCGTVFKVTPSGTESIIYSFQGKPDGSFPEAGLVEDSSGNFYGTTGGGGQSCPGGGGGCGTVFRLTPNGNSYTERVLYAFTGGSTDGIEPITQLVLDANGALYGATFFGGNGACTYQTGCGVVFALTPNGSNSYNETVLSNLQPDVNAGSPVPTGLVEVNGILYGVTLHGAACNQHYSEGCGKIFDVPAAGGGGTLLHNFKGYPTDGAEGQGVTGNALQTRWVSPGFSGASAVGGALSVGPSGQVVYGTTDGGGTNLCAYGGYGCGTIFSFSAGTNRKYIARN